ncbi:hypothetical protein SAMN05421641_10460 [Paracoccus thiocyanatus]|uniref:Uncharacterized protein n=2 Tax=Paracoccus thiocyanatus TaxID=34006 RepID=A0A1N6QEI5_9RHOB|nr:hypothetical protein SAMN05421641_10460 [Paracoccus thiocyanatus]
MRRKTRIERFLSWNQHRRRLGARKFMRDSEPFEQMKTALIAAGPASQSWKSQRDLGEHFDKLRAEFSGQPELMFHHAKLIVLIRRRVAPQQNYAHFRQLWDAECDFLAETLNIRWLTSAADTFVELDPRPEVRGAGMLASLLANMVKIAETERWLTNSQDQPILPERITELRQRMVPLFEGMSCFAAGQDDTLYNLYWRLKPFFDVRPTGVILHGIYNRLQDADTVFARLRAVHRLKKTEWWES